MGEGCCVDVGRAGRPSFPVAHVVPESLRHSRVPFRHPAHGFCAQPPSFRRKPESRGAAGWFELGCEGLGRRERMGCYGRGLFR